MARQVTVLGERVLGIPMAWFGAGYSKRSEFALSPLFQEGSL